MRYSGVGRPVRLPPLPSHARVRAGWGCLAIPFLYARILECPVTNQLMNTIIDAERAIAEAVAAVLKP